MICWPDRGNDGSIMNTKSRLLELKNKERDLRIQLILDAAKRVFLRKSYENISMKEIADEAGISISTIYTYFPGQESLFVEVCVQDGETLLREISQAVTNRDSMIISEIIRIYIDYYLLNLTEFYKR